MRGANADWKMLQKSFKVNTLHNKKRTTAKTGKWYACKMTEPL